VSVQQRLSRSIGREYDLQGSQLLGTWQNLTGKEGELPAKQSHATRIRLAVTELGTTYIKFGQMLRDLARIGMP
jgi:predicted unusual protein kinase regulating ubiquinone biosynthesis (AarF/ABC1/UbiB family)